MNIQKDMNKTRRMTNEEVLERVFLMKEESINDLVDEYLRNDNKKTLLNKIEMLKEIKYNFLDNKYDYSCEIFKNEKEFVKNASDLMKGFSVLSKSKVHFDLYIMYSLISEIYNNYDFKNLKIQIYPSDIRYDKLSLIDKTTNKKYYVINLISKTFKTIDNTNKNINKVINDVFIPNGYKEATQDTITNILLPKELEKYNKKDIEFFNNLSSLFIELNTVYIIEMDMNFKIPDLRAKTILMYTEAKRLIVKEYDILNAFEKQEDIKYKYHRTLDFNHKYYYLYDLLEIKILEKLSKY